MTNRRLHPEFFSLSIEDIALDCVADLFRQDENGRFYQVKAYFEGLAYHESSEEELLSHLRRLTFSKVNQGLFRLYNDMDPSLGKILRNIKLAVQALQNFVVVERFGEQCISPAMCETLEHLPSIERNELGMHLFNTEHSDDTVPALLAHLSKCLRNQSAFSRVIPIMDIAFAIRSRYSLPDREKEGVEPVTSMIEEDARRIIADACAATEHEMKPRYVGRNRIAHDLFEKYFLIIRENLEARFLADDGELCSFYDRLVAFLPGLSKDDYRRDHKSKIEYLGRLAHVSVIRELKRHF